MLGKPVTLHHVTETDDSGMRCKVSDNRSETGPEWLCVKAWHNFVTNDLTATLATFLNHDAAWNTEVPDRRKML